MQSFTCVQLCICNSHSFAGSFGRFIRSFSLFAEICETDIKRKISLCQELIQVVRVLEPGKSVFRGKLLVDLQEAMFAETERRISNGEISKLVARVCTIYFVLTPLSVLANIPKSENIKISFNIPIISLFVATLFRKSTKSSRFSWTKQIIFLNTMLP